MKILFLNDLKLFLLFDETSLHFQTGESIFALTLVRSSQHNAPKLSRWKLYPLCSTQQTPSFHFLQGSSQLVEFVPPNMGHCIASSQVTSFYSAVKVLRSQKLSLNSQLFHYMARRSFVFRWEHKLLAFKQAAIQEITELNICFWIEKKFCSLRNDTKLFSLVIWVPFSWWLSSWGRCIDAHGPNTNGILCVSFISLQLFNQTLTTKILAVWEPNSAEPTTTWHVTQRDATWRDVTWRDATWRDATWRDATRRDVTQRDATWRDVTRRDATQHNWEFQQSVP